MRTPTASEALGVWERGAGQCQAERGLALFGLACADVAPGTLADISIGARDTALLALREAMFGSRIEGCADCPRCGEVMEMNFSTAGLRARTPPDPSLELRIGSYGVTLRPVTSRDLLALTQCETGDPERYLLSRCVLSASDGAGPADTTTLPASVMDAAAQALADADPQADIKLSIACVACGHAWQAPFDILSYLWTELDAWARRTLREIHVLARAYGWRENDILALSPARRKLYLDMVAS
jgi:hypothetical protein